ncbi:MAG: hypothetical protein ABIG39_01480 [Candidatus Micrarchaeota archaeon]
MKRIFVIVFMFLIPPLLAQWNDCPYECVNDTYPGECGRYIDTDGDGICNHSQSAPEDRVSDPVINETASPPKTNVPTNPIAPKEFVIDSRYYVIPISVAIMVFYSISFILSRKKVIGVVTHRKIWNVLLLITFLVGSILGLLLAVRISLGVIVPLPFNMLFWHVEAGIAMTLIAMFHILWHWPYFKSILKR